MFKSSMDVDSKHMMIKERVCLDNGKKKSVLVASTVVLILASFISTSNFIADRYAGSAISVLDDPQTELLDVIDVTVDSLKVYDEAIAEYERAVVHAPLNAKYAKSIGDLYMRLALWKDVMDQMHAVIPENMSGKEQIALALEHMYQAVKCDPSNAAFRIALGQLHVIEGKKDQAREQFMAAVERYPVNSEIRYYVALNLLMAGMTAESRAHALILAKNDESYRLDDEDPRSVIAREQRLPWYEERLMSSYLYKAMEIMWQTGRSDVKELFDEVPDNIDAKETARLFAKQKGIAEADMEMEIR